MNQKIISQSFEIYFEDGTSKKFLKKVNADGKDLAEYRWSLTPSGDMLIYYVEYHHLLSAAVLKDERIHAYAAGVWTKVDILPDEVDKEEAPDEGAGEEGKE